MNNPQQQDLPRAWVNGAPVSTLPEDLFIPPDALEVVLEAFEGPLDLLWYLIGKQNINVLDIPVAAITEQYMHYIALMEAARVDLAADYLVMAAMLAQIKSQLLLPRTVDDTDAEPDTDPRAELVRRLQEYARFRTAANGLDQLARVERDYFLAQVAPPCDAPPSAQPAVTLEALQQAMSQVLARAALHTRHQIQRQQLSVSARMADYLERIAARPCLFTDLLCADEGRAGVVVGFLAILELIKGQLIAVHQAQPLGPIYLSQRDCAAILELEAESVYE